MIYDKPEDNAYREIHRHRGAFYLMLQKFIILPMLDFYQMSNSHKSDGFNGAYTQLQNTLYNSLVEGTSV